MTGKPFDYDRLAAFIRELRKRSGLTQDAVAAGLCCHRSAYSYLESGKVKPDLRTLHQLAAIFQIPFETFFYFDGCEGPEPVQKRIRSQAPPLPPDRLGRLTKSEQSLIAILRAYDSLQEKPALLQAMLRTGEKKIRAFLAGLEDEKEEGDAPEGCR